MHKMTVPDWIALAGLAFLGLRWMTARKGAGGRTFVAFLLGWVVALGVFLVSR